MSKYISYTNVYGYILYCKIRVLLLDINHSLYHGQHNVNRKSNPSNKMNSYKPGYIQY